MLLFICSPADDWWQIFSYFVSQIRELFEKDFIFTAVCISPSGVGYLQFRCLNFQLSFCGFLKNLLLIYIVKLFEIENCVE